MESMFDLGEVPSVNLFPKADETGRERPTLLETCVCPSCWLVQLSTLLPPQGLFTEYRYLSSASQTQVRYLYDLARMLAERFGVTARTRILALGSNDGTLLAAFRPWTTRVLGVDPAKNLAAESEARGVPMIPDFLTQKTAETIAQRYGQCALVLR
jgi:hypothetical protein